MDKAETGNILHTDSVVTNFGRAAAYYDTHADVQKETAERLIASLRPWTEILPRGPVLELGCGTGFVTRRLMELLPNRELVVTDISPEMVRYCREKLDAGERLTFKTLDAENLEAEPGTYAMTISGFAAQWFDQPALALGRCLEATRPGGLLLASFPGNESFPKWREVCRDLGLPYTGNRLPDTEEMVVKLSGGPVQVDYYEDTITRRFRSSADFFRHLKKIGAATQKEGRHLTSREMRLLIEHWDRKTKGKVEVSYHIVFIAVKRNYDD